MMWTIGFLSRIPPARLPSPALAALLLLTLLAGGFLAARRTGLGVRAGAEVGLVVSLLNMLVLGSLLTDPGGGAVHPRALWWIPGSLALGALLGGLGGALGRLGPSRVSAQAPGRASTGPAGDPTAGVAVAADTGAHDWTAAFTVVGAAATFCLLVVGGLVTSRGAGLDVPDWPSSFGYNMFLYPLARMSGGIYFEHSHRLFGSLVGLTTLVITLHLLRVEPRAWVRRTALAALALVVLQGILGGYRVTTAEIEATAGQVTATTETSPSLVLRVLHGVTGQLFLAVMVALAAFTARTWRSTRPASAVPAASTDVRLAGFLIAVLLVQLVLGALFRHVSRGLLLHIAMATVVLVAAVLAGARAAGIERGQPILQRLGKWILWLVSVQVLLGIAALTVRGLAAGVMPPPAYKVIVATAHQAVGALLLAAAVLLASWTRRLLRER